MIKLKIENFRSIKKIELYTENNILNLIGPNDSGKSNIIKKTKDSNKNVIILASKTDMYKRIEQLSQNLKQVENSQILQDIKKYLDETAQHTQLAKNILKGIAYHNGTMDKFLRFLIESAFKLGDIKILFGNSAITKGVNLSPDILLVLKYPYNKREFNEKINDIEIINAFGRTGRTKNNKQIGNIIILTTKNSKNKDFLIKGNKEGIVIKKPELKKVDLVNSFESAYKKYIASKSNIIISNENKLLLLKYLKPSKFIINNKNGVFEAIKSIFEIKFHHIDYRNIELLSPHEKYSVDILYYDFLHHI